MAKKRWMGKEKYVQSMRDVATAVWTLDKEWFQHLGNSIRWSMKYRQGISDIGDKCAAKILLVGNLNGKIISPSKSEWYGVNKLERDDEL